MEYDQTMPVLVTILVTIGLAIVGAFHQVFKRIDDVANDSITKVELAKKDAVTGDTAIWTAHNRHVESVSNYREAIARELGGVAKTSDVDSLAREFRASEQRIMHALSRIPGSRIEHSRDDHG